MRSNKLPTNDIRPKQAGEIYFRCISFVGRSLGHVKVPVKEIVNERRGLLDRHANLLCHRVSPIGGRYNILVGLAATLRMSAKNPYCLQQEDITRL